VSTDLITLRELTLRYAPMHDAHGNALVMGAQITDAASAIRAFNPVLRDEPNEVFGMLCLSTKYHVIAYHEVSRGSLDATLVHPREVFKAALLANAAAIVVAHNHPSGDPTPSPEDAKLTARLVSAGTLLGIPVLDHVVIGTASHFSFREAGRL